MVGFPNKPIGFPTKNDQHLGWRLGVPPFKEHPSFETTIWNNHFEIQWRSQTPLHFGSKRAVLTLTRVVDSPQGADNFSQRIHGRQLGFQRLGGWSHDFHGASSRYFLEVPPADPWRWLDDYVGGGGGGFKDFLEFCTPKLGEDVNPIFDSYFSNLGWFNHELDEFFFSGKGFQVGTHGLFRAHRIHGTGIRYIYLLHEWLICNGKCREH